MNRVDKRSIDNKWYILYFVIFLVAIIGYFDLFNDKYSLIWSIDGVGQYYPAFLYIGKYLRNIFTNLLHGVFRLSFFDLSIGMGEDIIGCLNYYGFGDPLNILSMYADSNNGAIVYTFMYFLRIFLAGLAFQKYCHYLNFNKTVSVFGAICYCFCGFAIYGASMYIEWLSVLIYFPLVLLGLEKLMKENKKTLLIVSITYGALCGFYYLFMVSLCLPIYVLVRGRCYYKDNKKLIKFILNALINYMVGLLLVAPIFIPSVKAYFESERSSQSVLEIIMNIDNYIPRKDKLLFSCILNPLHNRKNYFSNIAITETITLAILFIFIRNRKANQLKLAFSICFIGYLFPIVNYLFNGFGEETNRWLFILSFIVSIIFVYTLSYFIENDLLISSVKKITKKKIVSFICLITVINISFGIGYLFSDWKNEFINRDEINYYIESPFIYSKASEDNGLYRVASTPLTNINGRPENVAMINNYNGITYWFSIINQNTMNFASKYNESNRLWRSFGFGDSSILNGNIGCKYFITNNEINDENYILKDSVDFYDHNWNIYENSNYVEFAYLSNEKNTSYDKKSNNDYKIGEVSDINYDNNSNIFTCVINSESDAQLTILLPYSNNWDAYVNGKKVNISKMDDMFMSINIEGNVISNVEFKYNNKSILIGFVISIVTLIILFISKLFIVKKH